MPIVLGGGIPQSAIEPEVCSVVLVREVQTIVHARHVLDLAVNAAGAIWIRDDGLAVVVLDAVKITQDLGVPILFRGEHALLEKLHLEAAVAMGVGGSERVTADAGGRHGEDLGGFGNCSSLEILRSVLAGSGLEQAINFLSLHEVSNQAEYRGKRWTHPRSILAASVAIESDR
jgi:hypothetical protein